jgi:hypothetical protein
MDVVGLEGVETRLGPAATVVVIADEDLVLDATTNGLAVVVVSSR